MSNKSSFEIVLKHIKLDAPIDLQHVCEELDIKLSFVPMSDEMSGEIEKLNDGRYAININKYHHKNRQNFTIAHELGHFIHHRNLIGDGVDDTKMYRSENSGKYFNRNINQGHEREANSFAASFLMPKEQVLKKYKAGLSTSCLASTFQVSEAAMKYRLQGLGLTSNN